VVLAVVLALMALGPVLFPPDREVGWFVGYVGLLAAVLVAVCWIKGEPPRWRSGGD